MELKNRGIPVASSKEKATAGPNADFSCLLASFRRQRGLSLAHLGRASHLSRVYLHHLEQGRRTNPSSQVVRKIACALELPEMERRLLYSAYMRLTGRYLEEDHIESMRFDASKVVEAFVHGTSYPTHALDRLWFIPVWNEAALTLFELQGAMAEGKPLHLLEWLFAPHTRLRIAHWEQITRSLVSTFSSQTQTLTHLPAYKALWQRLWTLPDFPRITKICILRREPLLAYQFQIHHSSLGDLTLRTVMTRVVGSSDVWMLSYVPEDQHTIQQYHQQAWQRKADA